MSKERRTLKPGTTIEWVSRHLDLGIAETLEKAKAEGLKLNDKTLYSTRSLLRKQYGFKSPKQKGGKRSGIGATPGTKTAFVIEHVNQPDEVILKKAKAKGLDLSKDSLHKIRWTLKNRKGKGIKKGKEKAPTARASTKTNHKPDMPEKESQLRRLFFELGFDVVMRIYEEFSSLHGKMR